jgi:hypothetical protein
MGCLAYGLFEYSLFTLFFAENFDWLLGWFGDDRPQGIK